MRSAQGGEKKKKISELDLLLFTVSTETVNKEDTALDFCVAYLTVSFCSHISSRWGFWLESGHTDYFNRTDQILTLLSCNLPWVLSVMSRSWTVIPIHGRFESRKQQRQEIQLQSRVMQSKAEKDSKRRTSKYLSTLVLRNPYLFRYFGRSEITYLWSSQPHPLHFLWNTVLQSLLLIWIMVVLNCTPPQYVLSRNLVFYTSLTTKVLLVLLA